MDAFDAALRRRALLKRAQLPTEVYEAAASGDLPRERVGLALERLALNRTSEAVSRGDIQPQQSRDFYRMQLANLDQYAPAIEDATVREHFPAGSWAPVSPAELGMAGVSTVGGPMLLSRMFGKPMNLRGAAGWAFGPAGMPFSALGDVLSIGMSPFSNPQYQSGQMGYLSALGPGLENEMRNLSRAGREAREKYGIFGVPIQALHGIWNPITSTAYMLKNIKGSFDKAGSAALRAEQAVSRSLKGARHAVRVRGSARQVPRDG